MTSVDVTDPVICRRHYNKSLIRPTWPEKAF